MYSNYGTIQFNNELIQDISTRFILNAKTSVNNVPLFLDYIIKDWESPENIAYKLYDSCDYAWIILLANNIINPYTDWLLSNDELEEFIYNKYKNRSSDIHHYEYNGLIYYEPIMGATPITNYEYEYDKNEQKRKIRVVYPELLSQVVDALNKV